MSELANGTAPPGMQVGGFSYVPSAWGARFHARTEDEVFGAGAAGPGKTTVLMMDPLSQIWIETLRCQRCDIPDSFDAWTRSKIENNPISWGHSQGWILHLRRTLPRLSETIQRAHRIFNQIEPGVQWIERSSKFVFKSGLVYEFGHCKDRADYNNYLGKSYCLAKGQGVAMADGTFKAIETISAGEMVATLEGPKRVTATHCVGIKACVSASVRLPDGSVETSVFPTTHSVLLWPSEKLPPESRTKIFQGAQQSDGLSVRWISYESLLSLSSRPAESGVLLADEGIGSSRCCGQPQATARPGPLSVPVVLHEPTLLRGQLGPKGVCRDASYEQPYPGIAKCSPENCSVYPHPRDGQSLPCTSTGQGCAPQSIGAPSLSPTQLESSDAQGNIPPSTQSCSIGEYVHFYTGERRAVTEETRMGWMTMEPVGELPVFDLTVDEACHYISESNGLVHQNSYIAFDELIEFTKDQYDFICSRLRTSDPVLGSMLKIRSMSNPRMSFSKGTDIALDDPAWVKRYFVDPAPEGNKIIRKKIVRRDGTTSSSTRLYLPATLYDNPDKEFVKQYEAQLMSRPKHIRDCYLYGRWDLVLGAFLDEIWNPEIHVCKPFKIPASWPVFRACDWGYRSNGIICWLAQSPEGTLFVFHEAVFKEKTARYVAEKIVKPFEERNRLWDGSRGSKITGPADTQIWEERGESASNKYLEFQQAGVDWVRADKRSRATNAEVFVGRLNDHDNFTKEPGIVFFETCVNCTKTIPSMETDHHDIEAPRKGGWDHAWDCITYACQYAKQVGMDAPKYEPTFAGEDDEPQDKIADGPSYWWG